MIEIDGDYYEETMHGYYRMSQDGTIIGDATARETKLLHEIERLQNKYEQPGQKCGRGHVNRLPVSLWDCPMCTDELRKEIKKLLEAIEETDGSK